MADGIDDAPPRDEDEAAEEKPKETEPEFVSTLPKFPWEIDLTAGMVWWIEKQPNGNVLMKISPRAVAPNGQTMPLPPAIAVGFSPDGWDRFKRDVAHDGDAPPAIQTANVIPAFPPPGPQKLQLTDGLPHVLIVGPAEPDDADREWRVVHPFRCPWDVYPHRDDEVFGPDPADPIPDRRFDFFRVCPVESVIEGLGFEAISDAFGGEPVPEGRYRIRFWATYSNTWVSGEEWDSGLEVVE